MFCELLGKAEDCCRGKGGSMHIADQDNGNLGANAIVGGSAGMADQRRHGIDLPELALALGKPFLNRADIEAHIEYGLDRPLGDMRHPSRYWNVDHAEYGNISAKPVTRLARVAADNLQAAAGVIPSVTHHDKAGIDEVECFRKSLDDELCRRGVRPSALAFHVKALARTLEAFTWFQRVIVGRWHHAVSETLMCTSPLRWILPTAWWYRSFAMRIVKDYWILPIISPSSPCVLERAARPDDLGGASMTITNLGGIGGIGFTSIINPPEVAISGISRAALEPIRSGTRFVPITRLPLDLSYDHRVIDGAQAAAFLLRLRQAAARTMEDNRMTIPPADGISS